MKKLLLPAVLFCVSCLPFMASAQTTEQQAVITQLRAQLKEKTTAKDSLPILYDIFDLSPRKDYFKLVDEIYDVAERAGDVSAQLDICRQLTAVLKTDDDYKKVEAEVSKLPDSREKEETMLFLAMKRISQRSVQLPEDKRQEEVARILTSYESDEKLDNDQYLLSLFTLVEYLRNDASGDMLKKYLEDLYSHANSDHFELYAIPNIIYAETANAYTVAADQKKAVEADKHLLEVIDGLDKKYRNNGRHYRNYDISRFVCYRRMLRNFEALKPGEAQALYAKIQELAKTNSDVMSDLTHNPHTDAFYFMAIRDYPAAIPKLKGLYESAEAVSAKRRALQLLVLASEQTGDKATQLEALKLYNDILLESAKLNASERLKEMQIRYDIKDLQHRNATLELESKQHEVEATRTLMNFVLIAFVILALAFILFLVYWSKYRKNSAEIEIIANKLSNERDKLRHSAFHDYDANTYVEENINGRKWREQRKVLKRLGLDFSTFMTQSIVNDIMQVAFLGKDDRNKHVHPYSVDSIMHAALDRANRLTEGNRRYSMGYPDVDFKIVTDHGALSHVLAQLIFGMASHAGVGATVSLDCLPPQNGYARFVFTTPGDYTVTEDTISYKPIVSAEEMATGNKTGMFVVRIITLLVYSDIKEDKSYTNGTRFIFSTPVDLP